MRTGTVIGAWGLVSIALIPLANQSALHWIGMESSPFRHWAVAFGVPFVTLLPPRWLGWAQRFAGDGALPSRRSCGLLRRRSPFNTLERCGHDAPAAFVVCPCWDSFALGAFAALNLLCGAAVLVLNGALCLNQPT